MLLFIAESSPPFLPSSDWFGWRGQKTRQGPDAAIQDRSKTLALRSMPRITQQLQDRRFAAMLALQPAPVNAPAQENAGSLRGSEWNCMDCAFLLPQY